MPIGQIIQFAMALSEASAFALRAAEAANNGDEQAAKDYLKQARQSYSAARDKWDDA